MEVLLCSVHNILIAVAAVVSAGFFLAAVNIISSSTRRVFLCSKRVPSSDRLIPFKVALKTIVDHNSLANYIRTP